MTYHIFIAERTDIDRYIIQDNEGEFYEQFSTLKLAEQALLKYNK